MNLMQGTSSWDVFVYLVTLSLTGPWCLLPWRVPFRPTRREVGVVIKISSDCMFLAWRVSRPSFLQWQMGCRRTCDWFFWARIDSCLIWPFWYSTISFKFWQTFCWCLAETLQFWQSVWLKLKETCCGSRWAYNIYFSGRKQVRSLHVIYLQQVSMALSWLLQFGH